MSRDLTLHDGYSLSYAEGAPRELHLRAPDGRTCLSITIGPNGPSVIVEAAALAIRTEGAIALDCERFEVAARGDVSIAAGGGVVLEAQTGGIDLTANDAVSLEGERINLNTATVAPSPGALARPRAPR